MIEQEDISYIDEAPRLSYGVNIVREIGPKHINIFHIFTDDGYAMYRGPISEAVSSKAITERQQELYERFKTVLDKWANIPAYIGAHANSQLSNVRPLAYVYNTVFDLEFRHWVNQMLAYCGKNAMVILPSKNVPSVITECIVFSYARDGEVQFYGEYVRAEAEDANKK